MSKPTNGNGAEIVEAEMKSPGESPTKKNIDDVALLLINDAVLRETSMYYLNAESGKAETVWADGKFARNAGLILRSPFMVQGMSFLALFDMLLAVFSYPGILGAPQWVFDTSVYLQHVVWVIMALVSLVRVKFMMSKLGLSPSKWLGIGVKGENGSAAEPPWVFGQFITLFILTTFEWVWFWTTGVTEMPQANGMIMKCPPPESIFIHGWARAWVFIYFNSNVRDSLLTLLKVFTKLGPIFALLGSSFLGFFFIFQGLAQGVTAAKDNGFGPGGVLGDAMYNFFGLLTTVNHPDVVMPIVDEKWYTFGFILAYMFLTNIIGLNLLLAIVCGEYTEILTERLELKAKLRSDMLDTAFDRLAVENADGDLAIGMEVMEQILRKAETGKSGGLSLEKQYEMEKERVEAMPESPEKEIAEEELEILEKKADFDRLTMIVRLIDVDMGEAEGEEAVQDHSLDRQDLHELIVFYTAPIAPIPLTSCEYRFNLRREELVEDIQKLEEGVEGAIVTGTKEDMQAELESMDALGSRLWGASFPSVYKFAYKIGAGWPCIAPKKNPNTGKPIKRTDLLYKIFPYHEASMLYKVHTFYFLFYLGWCLRATANERQTDMDSMLLFISAIFQSIFFGLTFVGEMRWMTPDAFWFYFNSNAKRIHANWTNFLLLICLWLEFFSLCSSGSCMGSQEKDSGDYVVIAAACVGKVMQVANFAVETPSCLLLIKAIQKTLPSLSPHFGLFLAIYYGFAGMAIAFFCGKCMEANEVGGPGLWGQGGAVNGTSMMSKVPWGDTSYGGNPYYYNLNYDGFPNAFVSLYVVMIMNNWNVAANGPVEVTGVHYRWFFFIYVIMVAFVMINVLVGAIIDALSKIREEDSKAAKGEEDPLEVSVTARLEATKAPSGEPYSKHWELGDMPLEGEVRFDAALCPGLVPNADGTTLTHEAADAKQENTWLKKQNEQLKQQLDELQYSHGPMGWKSTGTLTETLRPAGCESQQSGRFCGF